MPSHLTRLLGERLDEQAPIIGGAEVHFEGVLMAIDPMHVQHLAKWLRWTVMATQGMAVPAGIAPRPTENIHGNDRTVAAIKAHGLLTKSAGWFGGTSTVQLRREIRAAADNPAISGIVLHVDSPGGTVSGVADLAADIRAASRRKPIVAHVDDLGASAAYWLASQADKVYANQPTALVGSIGTIQTIVDVSGALEKEGITVHTIRTGPLKGMGAPGVPVTDEQKVYLQSLVDAAQSHFDSAVQSGRRLTGRQMAAVKTGGVFPAPEAKILGLIDGIQSLDQTISGLMGR